MRYRKLIFGILGISLITIVSSCKKTFDNLLNNPNYPNTSTADVDLYLNDIQLGFIGFWSNASDIGAQLTRQQQWYGPFYRNGYTPASFDGMWTTAYTTIIKNANAMIPLAQAQKKYISSGIARVLEAYTYGTLVDDFGDIPFSEAVLGAENTNPGTDQGASIYAGVQTLLDSAISDFQKSGSSTPASDLYYAGNAANWLSLAKTLKLKYYMQVRQVDNTAAAAIQALLTENNLVNSASQDFVFKYGTNVTSPDSRHPHYAADYENSGGVGEYIGNYFMWMIAGQKYGGTVNFSGDPRLRYYFYRQSTNYAWANQQTCPCFGTSYYGSPTPTYPAWYPSVPDKTPFCVVGKGYTGRDHGDNSGTPPDANFRTGWGIYPAAGQFDANQAAQVTLSMGGLGAGIAPIWLSSFTSFLKAEAALTLGITSQGTPRSLLLNGVSASITKVLGFPATVNYTVPSAYIPAQSQINSYDSLVVQNYDTATTDDSRLNIIMTEYYLASWGNGVEPYNNYRLTGKPDNMQLARAVPNPGFFMRSFYYPSVYVNRNSNAPTQKTPGDAVQKVFWDNNPDNFVN
ncbi:MAG TPA: SusD/RagB family nutrient-binding outer membrane lipoprotein [Puia sp.]|nr:SusD/RagB family nutrient-binding outer membrane lipoprotein [Puia sp.]